MAYTEKTLQCSDCGKTFPFTTGEQEFFASKGLVNEPKRCPACRATKRARRSEDQRGNDVSRGPRQMYPATCTQCGKQTEVPFQPRGDKPVLCQDCFLKSKSK